MTSDLQALARRYDYRNTGEEIGDESDSWRRALYMAAGWPETGG
jgi:hypothetical protein